MAATRPIALRRATARACRAIWGGTTYWGARNVTQSVICRRNMAGAPGRRCPGCVRSTSCALRLRRSRTLLQHRDRRRVGI